MTAKSSTRISQHCTINSRWNSMTINAESTLIIYTMMDLKLAVNIQGRLQSNRLGLQFSMCHLHAPQQPEGKQNPKNYYERIREEWNTIATVLQTHVPNSGSSSARLSQRQKRVNGKGMKDEHWDDALDEKMNTELLFTLCANTRAPEHQVELRGSKFTTKKRFFLLPNAHAATGRCRGQKY